MPRPKKSKSEVKSEVKSDVQVEVKNDAVVESAQESAVNPTGQPTTMSAVDVVKALAARPAKMNLTVKRSQNVDVFSIPQDIRDRYPDAGVDDFYWANMQRPENIQTKEGHGYILAEHQIPVNGRTTEIRGSNILMVAHKETVAERRRVRANAVDRLHSKIEKEVENGNEKDKIVYSGGIRREASGE